MLYHLASMKLVKKSVNVCVQNNAQTQPNWQFQTCFLIAPRMPYHLLTAEDYFVKVLLLK
jgi:hypothetical protein